jgi:glycosyltransferase involved in cell wall biosynthesis
MTQILVGWLTNKYPKRPPDWQLRRDRHASVRMRYYDVANWINHHADDIRNELYRPDRCYDVVVFLKALDPRLMDEAKRARARGGKLIYDANVNYWDVWGEYDQASPHPTDEQQRVVTWFAEYVDAVVASSSVLREAARRLNDNVAWVPDNVNLEQYRGGKVHKASGPLKLIWSGVAHKSAHLRLVREALAELRDVQLLLISDRRPPVMDELAKIVPCRYRQYRAPRFPRMLLAGDVTISPKRLLNAYDVGHTAYKITPGMAQGLPAIASPQQSYVEALADGGGIICETTDEWIEAINRLRDPALRAEMGAKARRTVERHYSTAVVAARYARGLRAAAEGQPLAEAVGD